MNIFSILTYYRACGKISYDHAQHLRRLDNGDLPDILERRTEDEWFVCEGNDGVYPTSMQVEVVDEDGPYSSHYVQNSSYIVLNLPRRYRGHWCDRDNAIQFSDTMDWVHINYVYDHGFYCEDCGRAFSDGSQVGDYCIHCAEDHSNGLQEYGTDILHVIDEPFLTSKRRTISPLDYRYYGIELELDPHYRYNQTNLVNALTSHDSHNYHFILKEDSSIAGAELVSIPATYLAHKNVIPWADIFDTFSNCAKASNSCGMHIHTSRNKMSQLLLGKLLVFINHPNHKGFIEWVAGRPESTYCKKIEKRIKDGRGASRSERHINFQRHEAVNVLNKDTIELRIFASTTNLDTFFKNLEFFDATLNFLADTSIRQLRIPDFYRYVEANRSTYPNLNTFLNSQEFTLCA